MKKIAPIILAFILLMSCDKSIKETEVAVSSVSLSQATAEMIIGETVQLNATVLPSDATDKTVIWSSSKQSVARVNDSGVVTAIAEGASTITASCGGKSATCIITISRRKILVSEIRLSEQRLKLELKEEKTLTATVFPSDADDKTITWSSSNPAVANVDEGLVKAISEGEAIITASSGYVRANCVVIVYDPVPKAIDLGLSVKWASHNIGATSSEEYGERFSWGEIKPKDEYDWNNYKWGASNSLGKYVIDGAWGNVDNKTHLDFEDDAAIQLWGTDWRMPTIDEIKELYDNCSFQWENRESVSGTRIVSNINGNHIFLPAPMVYSEYGSAPVGAYWSSTGCNNAANVLVSGLMLMSKQYYREISSRTREQGLLIRPVFSPAIAVEAIVLDKNSLILYEGDSALISATISPDNATYKSVVWSSSDSQIASVDEIGMVTAIKEGTATITAKAGDKQASCEVIVNKKAAEVMSVTLDKESITVLVGDQATLIATVKPDDAIDKTITWTSSNSSVATVEKGVIKGVGIGKATITANAGNQYASCSVLVVKDSSDGVFAEYYGGAVVNINGRLQSGSQLNFGVVNYSSETIRIVSVQLIDGQTGNGGNVMSIGANIPSGSSSSWTITIGAAGIYEPKARFEYIFKGEAFTCEAKYTTPNWGF